MTPNAATVGDRALRPVVRVATALAVAGGLLSALALATDPHRFSFAWIWAFGLAWTVVVGALFFVVLQHLTKSVWSVVIRRVAEMWAASAWLVALLSLPVLAFAFLPGVFHTFPGLDPHHVAEDAVLQGKTPYLNAPFLAVRLAGFLLLWGLYARFYVGGSLAQDRGDDPTGRALALRRRASVFMPLFALSVTFASFDWLMGLDPHWFSTIFGVYVFAGMFVTALAVIALAVLLLRDRGVLPDGLVRGDHLYSLGTLIFAMSCFWAYIAFSQFLLIWYGNLPEETVFFANRFRGGWLVVTVVLAVVRFAVPFLVMMGRPAKSNPRTLGTMAVLVVAGQALDLYWLVMPNLHPSGPVLSWPEAGPLLLVAGVMGLACTRFLRRHPAVATGDPLFATSREFHL